MSAPRATAVYETIRVRGGRLPLLGLHLLRLEGNLSAVGLGEPPEGMEDRLVGAAAAGPADHMLYVEWNGTELKIENRPLPTLEPPRLITAGATHREYRVKVTEREVFDLARREAREVGADEALLLTEEGFVAEGTLFAVGWFDGDAMVLPDLDLGILPSIGRLRAVEVAGDLGIRVEEGRFPRSALDGKPLWITTAVRGVLPVAELDGVGVPEDHRVAAVAGGFWPSG